VEDFTSELQATFEPERLFERYIQVEEGMTEDEADAVLTGYRTGGKWRERRPVTVQGIELKRPCTYMKMYREGSSEEGTYFVRIYLDESSHVVGKEIGEFCR
jgi:hypothetical protein